MSGNRNARSVRFKRLSGIDEAFVYVVRGCSATTYKQTSTVDQFWGDDGESNAPAIATSFFKVGMTSHLEKRLKSITEGLPFPVGLVMSMKFGREVAIKRGFEGAFALAEHCEQWILSRLAAWRSHREWLFVPDQHLKEFADVLLMSASGFSAHYEEGPLWPSLVSALEDEE